MKKLTSSTYWCSSVGWLACLDLIAPLVKDPMRGFLEKVSQANGRTDGRTDGGELIGPISASGRGPKMVHQVIFAAYSPGSIIK